MQTCDPVVYKPSFRETILHKKSQLVWFLQNKILQLSFWLLKLGTERSNLISHAEKELRLAGFCDKDSDYGGMLSQAVLRMVYVFAAEGHSGFSANYTLQLFNEVARFRTLTPISSDPSEWRQVGPNDWQNIRDSRCFSADGGKTWYNYEDCQYVVKDENGATFTTSHVENVEENETIVRGKKCKECMLEATCERKTW